MSLDLWIIRRKEKKKIQINKKKQHVIKLKEIRLRPRIEDHDLMTKLKERYGDGSINIEAGTFTES